MRELEAVVRAFLSLLGWARALSKGSGAMARRSGRIAAHRRLGRWMR